MTRPVVIHRQSGGQTAEVLAAHTSEGESMNWWLILAGLAVWLILATLVAIRLGRVIARGDRP